MTDDGKLCCEDCECRRVIPPSTSYPEGCAVEDCPMKRALDAQTRWADEAEAEVERLTAIPYRCPVCGGRGAMPLGFYSMGELSSSATPDTCRACGGRGIIGGPR